MTQGMHYKSYIKATPQRSIEVQGTVAQNLEFKKPYDKHPNTPQFMHYYANSLSYLGSEPVPPLSDPSLIHHAAVTSTLEVQETSTLYYPLVGGDDGMFDGTGWSTNFDNTSIYVVIGRSTGYADPQSFIRFPNIQRPSGATLVSAKLVVTQRSGASPIAARIYMNKIANAVAPTNRTEGLALTYTTNYVTWTPTDQDEAVWETPELKTVVQEVLDLGFQSNSAMMFITDPTSHSYSTNNITIYTYNNSAKLPALKLVWSNEVLVQA